MVPKVSTGWFQRLVQDGSKVNTGWFQRLIEDDSKG